MANGIWNLASRTADEISRLSCKWMSPAGRAKRHGMTKSPIEWPLERYDAEARTLKNKEQY